MQTIPLAETGRLTTRLGFGCSSVMGALDRKDSLLMLEAAFDAGIRHFDVAPSYGFSEAEGCLGEFLARHPNQLTVTTKFGIPPEAKSWKSAVRSMGRPMLKMLPGLKAKMQRVAASTPIGESAPPPLAFNANNARESLERSLRALGVERIDLLLLHEATAAVLGEDSLLQFLRSSVESGKIGGFGVGCERRKIALLEAERPQYCAVEQYEWSVLDPLVPPSERFRIHHRSLTENFRALQEALLADAPRAARWSNQVGVDLREAEVLGTLMLKASLVCNPASVVLFSSKRAGHIRNNVAVSESAVAEAQALRLYALVRAEVSQPEQVPAGPPGLGAEGAGQ